MQKNTDNFFEWAKPIYVLVEVRYDYFRFQENLLASTDIKEIMEFAKKHDYFCEKLPIYDYEYRDSEYERIDNREEKHLWIQKFNNNITK